MEDNIYNFCRDGKCSQCGNCCSNLLPMSRKEVDAIHRYIRKNHIKECRHLLPTVNRPYDMTCPFLDTDKSCEKCRIYPVRPEICKQFICDNEQRAKHNRALLGQTRLKVLGSGSSGNCYILENENEALIIEAGLPFMEVKKALNFNVMKIVGMISSHEHGDHYKYFEQYKNAGINSACFGTGIPEYDADKMKYYLVSMGKFRIKIFPLVHDVPCYGFYITHPEMGSLVYASDTEYIKYRFKNVNHFMVESNYDMQFVDRDEPNYEHRLRGHMSLDTALKFISTNDNPALRNVVLIHLSDKSADSALFKQKTEETVKYGANVYIAEKGLEVDMNLCPF